MDECSIETDKYQEGSLDINTNRRDRSVTPVASAAISTKSRWLELRRKFLPVEILIVLFLILQLCSAQIYQQYFFQRYARELLHNYTNHTFQTVCLKQDTIVNYTDDNSSILEIQKQSNDLSMYNEVISLGTSAVVSLIYGPLSDRIGRKPVLALILLGLTLSAVLQVVIVELDLELNYFLISSAIYGCFGGLSSMLGVSFAAVSDVTPKRWLTLRMGVVESTIGFAKIASYLSIFYWINFNGCYFKSPVYLMIAIAITAGLYLLIWPESLQETHYKGRSHGFSKLVNGARIFFVPTFVGISKWWRVWVAATVICLECLCALGIFQITNYFLHNKPLQWSYDLIGIYGVVTSVANIFSLIVVLSAMVAIGLPDPLISIIGSVFAIISNVMIATIKTTWEMFLAGVIQGMQQVGFPAMRSVLAGLVGPEDYGSVLTITASLQMITSIGSTVLFNEVYRPQVTVDGHTENPGIAFWITAGIWFVAIPLSFLLLIKRNTSSPIQLVDEKSLLSSDKSEYGAVRPSTTTE